VGHLARLVSTPPPAVLAEVLQLYEAGAYLRAWDLARSHGPLPAWRGAEAEVLAGRLALALGAGRRGSAIHLRAARRHPVHPEAQYYAARAQLVSRGPVAAWQRLRRHADLPGASPEVNADWLALRASVAARFRDFDEAGTWLERAEALAPDRSWIAVERSLLLEMQDRFEEALAAALRPHSADRPYRPSLSMAARLLQRLGRAREALELLQDAAPRMESGSLWLALADLQLELKQPAAALTSLQRMQDTSPLAELDLLRGLAARRSDACYALGDVSGAREHALGAGPGFFEELARRLADLPPERRIHLEVPFVQQHHLTCAPASLAAVAAFFQRPIDHVALAREIAYDGTPGWRELGWAAAAGWRTIEFTVDVAAAEVLLGRGLPFLLTTVAATSAHEQVVSGLDARRGTLLIRDPSHPMVGEARAEPLLADQAPWGPRGLVLVPPDHAAMLDGIELPETEAWARLHALDRALEGHDREAAGRLLAELRATAPESAPCRLGAQRLARYDRDSSGLLAELDALLARFPGSASLLLQRVWCLFELGRRDEAIAVLRESQRLHPALAARLADELSLDARNDPECRALLRRVLRATPEDAGAIHSLAELRWNGGRRDEACELYRFAACLREHSEPFARPYFAALRHVQRSEEGIALLEARERRLGARSSGPARTLFWALDGVDRTPEAFEVLQTALVRHPQDGELLLFAAEALGCRGRFAEAAARLEQARGRCPAGLLARTSARLARWRGDLPAALAGWRTATEADPLDLPAHWEVVAILRLVAGAAEAREHLRALAERFPHHHEIQQAWLAELREVDPALAAASLCAWLERTPADAWAWRELALARCDEGQPAEALEALEWAARIDPRSPSYHFVRGHVLTLSGRREDAFQAYAEAIRLDAGHRHAVRGLLEAASGPDERRAALDELRQEILRQGAAGETLFPWRAEARGILTPDELTSDLADMLARRPDLWPAWVAGASDLTERGRLEEAQGVVSEACRRFPLLPVVWVERARVARLTGDQEGERSALEQALALDPAWPAATRLLCEVHERAGRWGQSRHILERALAHAPLDGLLHGYLADILRQSGDLAGAAAAARQAVQSLPGYRWAWSVLDALGHELGDPEVAPRIARELVAQQPANIDAALSLASLLGENSPAQALEVVERLLARVPRAAEAHEARARLLADLGRLDEALAACRPASLPEAPLALRGYAISLAVRRQGPAAGVLAMRELLAAEPTYHWGWSRVAEWAAACGDRAAEAEAIAKLVELAPRDPASHLLRAEVLLREERDAEARQALTLALDLDSSHVAAGSRLVSLLLEEGGLDAAEAAGRRLTDAAARAAAATRVATARADRDLALRHGAALCRLSDDPDLLWPPFRALAEAGLAGPLAQVCTLRPQAAELMVRAIGSPLSPALAPLLKALQGDALRAARRIAVELWPDAPAAMTWARALVAEAPRASDELLLAHACSAAGRAAEAEKAVRRALAADPALTDAWDLLATLLAERGRFDEAAAACAPPDPGTPPPCSLQGRAAWVAKARGEHEAAIRAMESLLQEHPRYEWGWRQLLDWLSEGPDRQREVRAAAAWAERSPGHAGALTALAQACTRAQEPARAAAAWTQALDCNPRYVLAAEELFDLERGQGNRAGARQALERLRARPGEDDGVLVRWVQLHLDEGDFGKARARFEQLCRTTSEDPHRFVDFAGRALATARQPVVDWLEGLAVDGETHPATARVAVALLTESGHWERADRLVARLPVSGAAGREARHAWLAAVGETSDARRLDECLARHRTDLQRHTQLWGMTGYALLRVGREAEAATWLRDHARRKDVEAWMLWNLSHARRRLGNDEAALDANRRALDLPPDSTTERHRVWAATRLAEKDAGGAERLVAAVDEAHLQPAERFVLLHVRAALAMARDGDGRGLPKARELLTAAVSAQPKWRDDAAAVRLRRRTVQRIAAQRGGLAGLWFRLLHGF
jgi:tetratricopeptide (TPR) repeat protein